MSGVQGNSSQGGAIPGGSDTHLQFNDGGILGGDSGLTYNKTTSTLSAPNIVATGVQSHTGTSFQAPTTGFTITIADGIKSLVLDPAGTLATGTINLPANPVDGQEMEISCSQIITALTVAAAGKTLKSPPTALALGGGFGYRYRASNTSWYRRY